MPQSGSNTRRLFTVMAIAAAVAIGAWLLMRNRVAQHLSPTAAGRTANGVTANPDERPADTDAANVSTRKTPLKRVAAATPLPPASAPLARAYDELKTRADAGDASAASRLYHDVSQCVQARSSVPTLRAMIDSMLARDDHVRAPEELARKEKSLAALEQELAKQDAVQTNQCLDLDEDKLQIVPAAMRAAQLGDDAAADCYVDLPFAYLGKLLDHPEWLTQYKAQALDIANAAVARGDWTMVAQLQYAYSPLPADIGVSFLKQITGTDPALAYRYGRLLRLGVVNAADISASKIDQQLQELSKDLSATTIRDGDRWADDAYHRYFAGNPDSLDISHMTACRNQGEAAP